jgi:hypothetical protein
MARLRTAHPAYKAASSLGRKNGSPTWAAPAGPHVVSRPSSFNGHARNPAEQNRCRRPCPNPSAQFPSPSLSSTHAAMIERPRLPADERPSARRGEETGPWRRLEPLVGVCAHCWVDVPSSSGLTMASLYVRSPTRWRALAPSWSLRRACIHKRCTG